VGLGLSGLLALCAAVVALDWALIQLQQCRGVRAKAFVSTVLVSCAVSLAWFGVERDDPVAQLLSKQVLANLRASQLRAADFAEVTGGLPDPQYQAFSHVKLSRKPSVQLLMIEAYGELAAVSDTRDAYRVLLNRIEARLGASGFSMRTAYSQAPVYGGRSWLSLATVQMGMHIDTPRKYELVENTGALAPSLTRFFKDQGYFTAAVQPGNTVRTGLKSFDIFNRDRVLDAPELAYTGLRYGWQGIPDQYTLGRIGELLPTLQRPYFLFYMSVSTHHAWDAPFVYVRDWKALNDPNLDVQKAEVPWEPIAERAAIDEVRRGYFRTLEYEWRCLAEEIDREGGDDTLFVIMGDHQPKLPANDGVEITWRTPVHVISKDKALVDAFAGRGFAPGLFVIPAPAQTTLQHEGIFSLLVSQLAAQLGDEAHTSLRYAPSGISLASIYQ
jgi:hypothetical protein